MELYRAGTKDREKLRTLARESEAHWGYDSRFMEVFDQQFNITEEFISQNPVYLAEDFRGLLGFWGLARGADSWELEYFYICSGRLNTGIGRKLWGSLAAWCRKNSVKKLEFVTSPQAAGFYEKMGAVAAGEKRSVIDGRLIPFFRYAIDG